MVFASPTSAPGRARRRPAPRLRGRRPDDVAAAARRALRRVHGGRLGRAGHGRLVRSAGRIRHRRLRRLPGRIHPRARSRSPERRRPLVRRHPRPRVPPPASRRGRGAGPGVGLRGLGRLPADRGRRAAPAAGARPRRSRTGRVRRHAAADDVRRGDAAGDGRRLRRQHADSTRPASAPWPAAPPRTSASAAPDRRPDAARLRREGRARRPVGGRDLQAAITGAKLVVLPGVGHVCNIEAPDEFNDAVRTFLHDVVT